MSKAQSIVYFLSLLITMNVVSACQSAAVTPASTVPQIAQTVTPDNGLAPTAATRLTPASPTPAFAGNLAATITGDAASPQPPTLAVPTDLKLNGKLLLSDYNLGILQMDLSTKQITPIFSAPENGFMGSAVLSPDGKTFFLIYSRPRELKDPHYGTASLYTLSGDGSGEPIPLLKEDDYDNYYYSLAWSPDEQSIYYGRLYQPLPGAPATQPTGYFLDQYALPDGTAQDLLPNVLAGRISTDGQKLFYVSIDPSSTLSNIYVADADGRNPKSLLPGAEKWIVNSLAVAPDGQSLVFSSADSSSFQASLSWLDRLMGVEVAQAHDVPSDLFIMNIGESPRQLTFLADSGFIEDFSPDGQYIAFTCGSGTYLIRPDGSGQIQISSAMTFGNLQWVRSG